MLNERINYEKEEERNIYAVFDDKTIRVYQAYNNENSRRGFKNQEKFWKTSLV